MIRIIQNTVLFFPMVQSMEQNVLSLPLLSVMISLEMRPIVR